MSTIQYGWHRSQFVTPKPNEIVWVVDDEKEVILAVYEVMCKDGTPWRVFGETTRLYGFRWWQRCADNMRPPPEPPVNEGVKAVIDAENAKYPGITHGLDGKPIRRAAAQEGVYGPGDPPDMAPSLLPQNPDRVNAPEPLGEPANVRTELMILTEMVRVLLEARNAFDIYRREVDARLDEIEKHTDFSHNSK